MTIDFLKCLQTTVCPRYLANEQHHRCRILCRYVNTDTCVGRARPAGHEGQTRFGREFSVGFGCERRPRFMTVGNQAKAAPFPAQCLQDSKIAFTGYTKPGI